MGNLNYDILLVGGGLVNGLLAWQLKRIKPWLNILVLEQGNSFGGKHTWSFHEEDLSFSSLEWIRPLISASWPSYRVVFPDYEREVNSRYFSIRSRKFHEVLLRELAGHVKFGATVVAVSKNQVVLKEGTILTAKWVVDGRGATEIEPGSCGFQKFFGLEVELNYPHGLTAPVLMDATVKQVDGYRFLYCLPWTETRLLVEDTRYSDEPDLNGEDLRKEVLDYCASRNWQVKEVFYEETGCLPLPLTKRFVQGKRLSDEVNETPLTVGMRAGLFHPTTGYSFPMAVKTVELLLKLHEESLWESGLAKFREDVYQKQGFYILLNRVMFRATRPETRFKFLQHFYRLPSDLINRFYAHDLGLMEKMKFFLRTPPVSVKAAFDAVRSEIVYEL